MQEHSETIIEEKNLRIHLIPSRRKKTRKINVVLEGELSIKSVEVARLHLEKLQPQFEVIAIALKNITTIDLAAIQLMQVLRSSAEFSQHTITIESELSKEDRSLLVNAGLIDLVSR